MRENYLERMGVTVWHSRDKASVPYFQCRLQNAAGKSIGLILAEIGETVSIMDQENLLQKIAGALTDNITIEHRVLSSKLLLENPYDFIIFLGKINAAHIAVRTIHSFSLIDLIQNPEHKKVLWNDIKQLK